MNNILHPTALRDCFLIYLQTRGHEDEDGVNWEMQRRFVEYCPAYKPEDILVVVLKYKEAFLREAN